MEESTPAQPPSSPSSTKEPRIVTLREAILIAALATVIGAGSVFYWYDIYAGRSMRILEQHIYEVKAQRDLVLHQRADMKNELDAYKAYVLDLTGEEGLPSEEEEESEEEAVEEE